MIEIKCYKREEIGYPQPEGGMRFIEENTQTAGWGRQIKSWRDVITFDDEDDYPDKNTFSDKVKESLR